jgi:DNA-binding MarR family transcriptional regulator
MEDMPTAATIAAWTQVVRASRWLTDAIEGDVKRAGFPPLSWYDVLLELSRAPEGRLTPGELEERTLFAQYNLSRLLDRLQAEGLVNRLPFPGDRRRQLVEITGPGLALRKVMWPIYGEAIEKRLGTVLGDGDAEALAALLGKILRSHRAAE